MAIIDELKTRMEFDKETILKCYPCASTWIKDLIFIQKAIDIIKACEWLEENMVCDNDPNIIPNMIKDFRKAMEEEQI